MISDDFLTDLPYGIYRSTPNGRIEYANSAIACLLGYQSSDHLLSINSRHIYKDLADREAWQELLGSTSEGTFVEFKTTWRRADQTLIRVKDVGRAIRVSNTVVAYEGFVINASEAPEIVGPLRSQDSLDTILDSIPILVTRQNLNLQLVWANKAFCQAEVVTLDELCAPSNSEPILYDSEFSAPHKQTDENVLRTGTPFSGVISDMHVLKVPLFAADGHTVVGIERFAWHTEPEYDLEGLIQKGRYKQLLSSPLTAVYEHDSQGNFTFVNDAAVQLIGRLPTELLQKTLFDVVDPDYVAIARDHVSELLVSERPDEAVATYELQLLGVDNRRIPVELTSRVLMRNGRPAGIIGYVRDLTLRVEAEQRRLSEVHHRVKNNLHTINVLLEREKNAVRDNSFAQVLKDCQMRVLAIADLHEQLYRSNRVSNVAVADYVRSLARKLVRAYAQSWQDINTRVTVANELYLSLDAMIPIGLVLQELISNAMKHAFPRSHRDTRRGSIMINLSHASTRGQYQLQVVDSGVGMPFQPESPTTLGMKLIFGLVERQLNGSARFDSTGVGTSFSAHFSDPSPIERGAYNGD